MPRHRASGVPLQHPCGCCALNNAFGVYTLQRRTRCNARDHATGLCLLKTNNSLSVTHLTLSVTPIFEYARGVGVTHSHRITTVQRRTVILQRFSGEQSYERGVAERLEQVKLSIYL